MNEEELSQLDALAKVYPIHTYPASEDGVGLHNAMKELQRRDPKWKSRFTKSSTVWRYQDAMP